MNKPSIQTRHNIFRHFSYAFFPASLAEGSYTPRFLFVHYLCRVIVKMGCTRHSSSKLDSALICTIFAIKNYEPQGF